MTLSLLIDAFLYINVVHFFSDMSWFETEGFGTVFDGVSPGGSFENLSTQAVMDLIRNVNVEQNSDDFVGIDVEEVERFEIKRIETTTSGNLVTFGKIEFEFSLNF
jgi:hypothetical protein